MVRFEIQRVPLASLIGLGSSEGIGGSALVGLYFEHGSAQYLGGEHYGRLNV